MVGLLTRAGAREGAKPDGGVPHSATSLLSLLAKRVGGLPRCHSGKGAACQWQEVQETQGGPWAGKVSSSRKWQSSPVFLPKKFHGQRSLVSYSLCGHKELDRTDHILSSKGVFKREPVSICVFIS